MTDRGIGPVGAGMRRGFEAMVRRGLRGVWWRGDPPSGAFVWAANHHSWWDPFLASVLLERLHRLPSLLMLQENLDRFQFARRVGVFGTDEFRRGVDFLRAGRVLILFPEGELRPAGPLGPVAGGAAWFAVRAPAPLCAVATRVVMRGHQAPEAYVWFHPVPVEGPGPTVGRLRERLEQQLTEQLTELDRLQAETDPRTPLPGFTPAVVGRRSWDERIGGWSQWRR